MKKATRIICLMIAVFSVFSLISCSRTPASRKKGDGEVVMTVGEYKVTRDLYNYFYNGFMTQYGADSDAVKTEAETAMLQERSHNEALLSLKKFYAVYKLAADYGIDLESADFKAALQVAEEEFILANCDGSADILYDSLNEQSTTYEAFMMLMEHGVVQNALYEELIYQNVIDAEALAGDGENPDFKDNVARVKHVLVKFEPTYKNIIYDTTPEKEAALATAESVYTMAINGTDFDTLVKEYGDDMTMFANKIGTYVFMGNQNKAYEDAVFALKEGEISTPILTDEGYVVIQRLALDREFMRQNFSSLITSCMEGQFNILVEEAAETLTVTEKAK